LKKILEIKDLWKNFGGELITSTERIPVLMGVDLDIEENNLTALIGGNGAGKTTLLNIINGFLSPDKGKINYQPKEKQILINNIKPNKVTRLGIGRLFQGTRLFGNLSVRENLLIACNEFGIEKPFYNLYSFRRYNEKMKSMNNRIEALLNKLESKELLNSLNKNVKTLSYAQQRIINLISLLLGDYNLVLLDEPTSGINTDDWEIFEVIINEMKLAGITIFLIEHNMEFVRKYVQTCYYMSSGKILVSGNTNEVLNHPMIKKEYLAIC